ncbi:MAG: DUF1553 domain-containing protein [Verrucomicrobiota bacterium]
MKKNCLYLCLLLLVLHPAMMLHAAPKLSADQLEFFESRIRPILAQECYECHRSGGKVKGGLVLDHREALLKGGDSGKAMIAGDAAASLLLQTIRHQQEDLKMPKAGAKLDENIIADFEKWINMGAPDPRDRAPTDEEFAAQTDWDAIRERRQLWWSFQPVKKPSLPEVKNSSWSQHPVDQFILSALESKGLKPAGKADRRTLIRRASLVLTGLPPTPQQVEVFLQDESAGAYKNLINYLLDAPQFGERWARHWMDWVRYAETHGSEGDPAIPHAYRYRDYLIRALNADVPYDQLMREHIAGDLLENPRINKDLGLNESAIGTAFWRMVFHGFAPTDALDEKVRFTDDQINVFSKTFMGLTVSCARCHNHKFDAISQADYYALFGILGSTRPALIDVSAPGTLDKNKQELTQLKKRIKTALGEEWLKATRAVAENFLNPKGPLQQKLQSAKHPDHFLYCISNVRPDKGSAVEIAEQWGTWEDEWQKNRSVITGNLNSNEGIRWDLGDDKTYQKWFSYGEGLEGKPARPGEFALHAKGDSVVSGVFPAGSYSHLLSDKHRAVLASKRIAVKGEKELWLQMAGDGQAMARYVVQNYPRSGTVYPVTRLKGGEWLWKKYDLTYWDGDDIHIELSTAADQAVLANTSSERSWFGIRNAVLLPKGAAPPNGDSREWLAPLFEAAQKNPPKSAEDVAQLYQSALRKCIAAWQQNKMNDSQALFLNEALKAGLLPNEISSLATAKNLVAHYRKLEAQVPLPTRVPGLFEADNYDQAMMVRGDHKELGELIPRRFLEAIDANPYQTKQSGRLELANDLVRPDNAFTARVMVNRLWHYLYGQGIVPTTDNFGRLGEKPSHPQLLDYLATRFVEKGWSIKDMIRFMVTSESWQLSSDRSQKSQTIDPDNRLLAHANIRRLDAEAIRDSLLLVSNQLDPKMFGPASGGKGKRRSIYVQIRRNSLDPFLAVFDAPVPFATKGRRDSTNVPAQSLTLLNDRFVINLSAQWIKKLAADPVLKDDSLRITRLFETALGRPPSALELSSAQSFIADLGAQYESFTGVAKKLELKISDLNTRKIKILEPVRKRLLAELPDPADKPVGPKPFAWWDFEKDFKDQLGKLHGKAFGKARIADGALVVDGRSHVATEALAADLKEKTLEVLVVLDDINQRGGGAITVQSLNGSAFDSIVIGERQARRWISGSNGFVRTLDFKGATEEVESEPVRMAMVYEADGTIRAYRNGEPYGAPYKKTGLHHFKGGDTQILFALRHGKSGGNRMLKGRILEAKLYDRALNEKEIAAAAGADFQGVTSRDVRKALSGKQRQQLAGIEAEIHSLEKQKASYDQPVGDLQAWADLAHAIFNLKEFIYIK